MSTLKKSSYDELYPKYGLQLQEKQIDFPAVFGNQNRCFLEIGFGMGAATTGIATCNPDKNYIGIEVHVPGIAKLLHEIEVHQLSNIRVIHGDAVEVLQKMVPDGSLFGVHVFFPDPWPKKRQQKRRLINRIFLEELAPKLCVNGYLYLVTDWQDYAEQMLRVIEETAGMVNRYNGFADPVPWRPETRFERRGLELDHPIFEIMAERL